MSKWFIVNILIFCFAWGKIIVTYHGIHMVIGGIAITLVLYNWTRHAVFSTIRSPKVRRKRKIAFAKLSKRVLPVHKWTGSSTLLFALIHMYFVLNIYGLHFGNFKLMSGFLTIIILVLLVLAGWLRWYKTTVVRRYTHWTLAYMLIFSIIIHLLV